MAIIMRAPTLKGNKKKDVLNYLKLRLDPEFTKYVKQLQEREPDIFRQFEKYDNSQFEACYLAFTGKPLGDKTVSKKLHNRFYELIDVIDEAYLLQQCTKKRPLAVELDSGEGLDLIPLLDINEADGTIKPIRFETDKGVAYFVTLDDAQKLRSKIIDACEKLAKECHELGMTPDPTTMSSIPECPMIRGGIAIETADPDLALAIVIDQECSSSEFTDLTMRPLVPGIVGTVQKTEAKKEPDEPSSYYEYEFVVSDNAETVEYVASSFKEDESVFVFNFPMEHKELKIQQEQAQAQIQAIKVSAEVEAPTPFDRLKKLGPFGKLF